jgi:hypothetical protein
MKHPFEAGETYWNPDFDNDLFVLAVEERPATNCVVLAVLKIDIHTKANLGADDIIVKSVNFSKWKKRGIN